MTITSMNATLAVQILDTLFACGVRDVCVCAGARNSPFVRALSHEDRFRVVSLFEERSAAFFALGRIKATGRPAAVFTTSGTAAGELLPATMEAYYSSLPLVLVTADRPRHYRGTGAPQTAEQVGLFGLYAAPTFDLAHAERLDLTEWPRTRPLHINVCFEEPLLAANPDAVQAHAALPEFAAPAPPVPMAEAQDAFRAFRRDSTFPIVIVGALAPKEQKPVREFLLRLGAPCILEALSGLREDATLLPLALQAGAIALTRSEAGVRVPEMDGVLRLGSVPTLRLWRDLEDRLASLPLLSFSAQPFAGASRGTLIHGPLPELLSALTTDCEPIDDPARRTELIARDRATASDIRRLLEQEPRSEPGLIASFSERIPADARLFLGNSLPIREWDLAATQTPRGLEPAASRGLNGIDGQISTFLGFCRDHRENWALLGDLTALYDMAAPWLLSQMPEIRAHIAVVNNGGGMIFDRMFHDPAFQNRHVLDFAPLARFWSLDYERWEDVPASLADRASVRSLSEIVPDPAATARFWQSYDALIVGKTR